MKRWYQSRTVWVGIVEIALGITGLVADQLATGQEWTALSVLAIVSGALTIILRKITEKPIRKGW